MRILIVEDIQKQVQTLENILPRELKRFGDLDEVIIQTVATEKEFYTWADAVESDANVPVPDVVIIDLMLPLRPLRVEDYFESDQESNEPELPPMDEAGFRCAERLEEAERTKSIPFLFYSAIAEDLISEILRGRFSHIRHKRKDGDYASLCNIILELIKLQP